jgi:hypothetical protein
MTILMNYTDSLYSLIDVSLKQPHQFAGVNEALLAAPMLLRIYRAAIDSGVGLAIFFSFCFCYRPF